jgi:hypothetical protein
LLDHGAHLLELFDNGQRAASRRGHDKRQPQLKRQAKDSGVGTPISLYGLMRLMPALHLHWPVFVHGSSPLMARKNAGGAKGSLALPITGQSATANLGGCEKERYWTLVQYEELVAFVKISRPSVVNHRR